jgi:hypothetical protein
MLAGDRASGSQCRLTQVDATRKKLTKVNGLQALRYSAQMHAAAEFR